MISLGILSSGQAENDIIPRLIMKVGSDFGSIGMDCPVPPMDWTAADPAAIDPFSEVFAERWRGRAQCAAAAIADALTGEETT